MTDDDHDKQAYASALETAADLLGTRLEPFLEAAPGEPPAATDFKRLATTDTFGDAWPRTQALDTPTRALISVTIAATLGTFEPLRGQVRIALNNGVTPDQIVEAFIHIEAAGAARAFDSYRIAQQVFAEQHEKSRHVTTKQTHAHAALRRRGSAPLRNRCSTRGANDSANLLGRHTTRLERVTRGAALTPQSRMAQGIRQGQA
jgi:4-carboxymuconolactone decarboxylase